MCPVWPQEGAPLSGFISPVVCNLLLGGGVQDGDVGVEDSGCILWHDVHLLHLYLRAGAFHSVSQLCVRTVLFPHFHPPPSLTCLLLSQPKFLPLALRPAQSTGDAIWFHSFCSLHPWLAESVVRVYSQATVGYWVPCLQIWSFPLPPQSCSHPVLPRPHRLPIEAFGAPLLAQESPGPLSLGIKIEILGIKDSKKLPTVCRSNFVRGLHFVKGHLLKPM